MAKRIFLGVSLIILAFIAFIFALACLLLINTGHTEIYQYYGGDAYTGIQHAAALTASNVHYVACAVKDATVLMFFFVSLLLSVLGIYQFLALPGEMAKKKEKSGIKERSAQTRGTRYKCPDCNADVTYGEMNCENCGIQLDWE